MSIPRPDLLRDLAAGEDPIFATVSGAHLYGFESADSDIDLRGAFVGPAGELLGLGRRPRTRTSMRWVDGVELDWVAHDVLKTVRLAVRGSGEVLEQIRSPLIVTTTPWHAELLDLARPCETRVLARHYLGFLESRRRLLEGEGATVKVMLYAYRAALTGVVVLEGGGIEANLPRLVELHPQPGVEDLVARKRAGAEKGLLAPGEARSHATALDALGSRLHDLATTSPLPASLDRGSPGWRALDDFLVRVRREATP